MATENAVIVIAQAETGHTEVAPVGGVVVGFAYVMALVDRVVIDGFVNWLADLTVGIGRVGRAVQTGQVQTYAWVVFGGLVIVAAAVVLPTLAR